MHFPIPLVAFLLEFKSVDPVNSSEEVSYCGVKVPEEDAIEFQKLAKVELVTVLI